MGAVQIDTRARYICERCGCVGKPRRELRGSPALELVLWLLLVVPGALYAWWRHSGARPVCRRCGDADVVREDSPRGMTLRGAGHVALEEPFDAVEQASRVVRVIPLAGGVLIVALFALSIAFPDVRTQRWFAAVFVLAAVAIFGHQFWSGLYLLLRLIGKYNPGSEHDDPNTNLVFTVTASTRSTEHTEVTEAAGRRPYGPP